MGENIISENAMIINSSLKHTGMRSKYFIRFMVNSYFLPTRTQSTRTFSLSSLLLICSFENDVQSSMNESYRLVVLVFDEMTKDIKYKLT